MWISSVAPVPMAWAPESAVVPVEEHLEEPAVVAEDLAAGDLAVPRHADLVGHLGAVSSCSVAPTMEISGMA